MLALGRLAGAGGNVGGAAAAYFGDRAVSVRGVDDGNARRIDYFDITTTGSAALFGLTIADNRSGAEAVSGEGRGVVAGGTASGGTINDSIEYFTFATTGNTTSFGDLTGIRRGHASASDGVRGMFAGGTDVAGSGGNAKLASIDYITIATTGNAADFGDLTVSRQDFGGVSNGVRGIFAAGTITGYGTSNAERTNVIDYVTIATTGNAVDYGDYVNNNKAMSSSSNSTRGIFAGGFTDNGSGSKIAADHIGYLELNTTGNAATFGSLLVESFICNGTGNSTRAVFITIEQNSNKLQYVSYATTANSAAFGSAGTNSYEASAISGD
tara:strand:- start:4798 stop:5775 length:978 start_codon:yes stop_codon:yes gene_type:complete